MKIDNRFPTNPNIPTQFNNTPWNTNSNTISHPSTSVSSHDVNIIVVLLSSRSRLKDVFCKLVKLLLVAILWKFSSSWNVLLFSAIWLRIDEPLFTAFIEKLVELNFQEKKLGARGDDVELWSSLAQNDFKCI